MRFRGIPTCKSGLPLAGNAAEALAVTGTLYVTERKDHFLRRSTMIANVCDDRTMNSLLPLLFDARLTLCTADLLTIRGWERIPLSDKEPEPWRECGKSWLLRPVDDTGTMVRTRKLQ